MSPCVLLKFVSQHLDITYFYTKLFNIFSSWNFAYTFTNTIFYSFGPNTNFHVNSPRLTPIEFSINQIYCNAYIVVVISFFTTFLVIHFIIRNSSLLCKTSCFYSHMPLSDTRGCWKICLTLSVWYYPVFSCYTNVLKRWSTNSLLTFY